MKENGFTLKKTRRQCPAETITDVDYAEDIARLIITPTQAEFLLFSLKQSAGGIGLHLNAGTTEYMCFNKKGDISTLNGSSLKLVDKITFIRGRVSHM